MSIRNLLSWLAIFVLACVTFRVALADDPQSADKKADEAQPADEAADQLRRDKPRPPKPDEADEPAAPKEQPDAKEQSNPKEPPEQEEPPEEEPDDYSNLAQRWLERMRRLGRRNPNEKNHDSIKAAFLEISKPASDSIALVFSGDEPKAIGAVVSPDGYILTKASELDGELSCRLKDGRHLRASLVGVHQQHDLAMLKINAADLTPIVWETEVAPPVGSWLVTPSIEDSPLAIGVVSVPPRRIRQTPGVLGVSLDDGEDGAKITEVMRRSAAEKAGLKVDDVVLSANGQRTKNREALVREIRKHLPGDEVSLKIKRGETELELKATLGSHFTSGPAARSNFQNELGGSLSMRRAGFEQALQHDTVLQPAECGGPVLNLDGKAVGINIARAGRVNSYALPAKLVVAVIDDLKSGKYDTSKLADITKLKRQIEQAAATVEKKEAEQAGAEQRLKQSQDVLQAALDAQAAANAALNAARDAAQAAQTRLEKLQAELDKLQAE